MFKKTIKYTNFNGDEVERDFYFHLTQAELLEMGVGDMQKRIQRIVEAKDNIAILHEMQALVRLAVGIRSEDGETFIKNDEARNLLLFSPAYDELLVELCTNADAASNFIKNLLPEKMQKAMLDKMENATVVDPFQEKLPSWIEENRNPTSKELVNATQEQLKIAFARKLNG